MAEVLPVFEHDAIPVVQSREAKQKELEQKHADALEKLEKKLPSKSWAWGNGKIKFANFCGVISLGNLSIEILPKIYGSEADVGSNRNILVRMLSKARRLKLHEAGRAGISLQKRNLLDVFILHFCEQLHAQLTQGMIRKYVKREKNLNVLRGRLLTERQFKFNLAHRERLFCRYDELSEDNAYNRILKFVLGILLKAASGNRAFQQVSELLMRFDPVSDSPADSSSLDSLNFDRLTERYEPIFDQCGYFLKGFYPDVLTGNNPCLSVLFDMNKLFEEYVGSELRKEAQKRNLMLKEQGPSEYLARRQDSEEHIFRMKPDFSFLDRDNQVVGIADAKWKILDEKEKNLGISQADMYQMKSYASRYGAKRLALIYPMQKKLTKTVRLTLEGSEATLVVLPVDLSKKEISLPLWPELP